MKKTYLTFYLSFLSIIFLLTASASWSLAGPRGGVQVDKVKNPLEGVKVYEDPKYRSPIQEIKPQNQPDKLEPPPEAPECTQETDELDEICRSIEVSVAVSYFQTGCLDPNYRQVSYDQIRQETLRQYPRCEERPLFICQCQSAGPYVAQDVQCQWTSNYAFDAVCDPLGGNGHGGVGMTMHSVH